MKAKRSTCGADGSVRHQAPKNTSQGFDDEDFHKRGSRLADEPSPFVAHRCFPALPGLGPQRRFA